MELDADAARWLLAHINDNSALSSTDLLGSLPGLAGAEPQTRADMVRTAILDSIEFLRPPRSRNIRSVEARVYAVLWLRYVEGMTVEEVSEEIALSERQAHRELRAAESKFAAALSAHLASAVSTNTATDLETGDIRVVVQPEALRLTQAVRAAVDTVEPLARSLGRAITVHADLPNDHLFADEGVLSQVLTQMLSLVIQASVSATVSVTTSEADGGMAEVVVGPVERSGRLDPRALQVLERLAASVQMTLLATDDKTGVTICLRVPLRQPKTVLVVEDSDAAVELYRRFLEPGGEWRVVEVSDPKLAYDTVRRVQPAVVLLDLLMPGADGWTVLNVLRARDDTVDIPVIVCSVFRDPLLAEALGASAHLRKPISQAELMSALRRWAR